MMVPSRGEIGSCYDADRVVGKMKFLDLHRRTVDDSASYQEPDLERCNVLPLVKIWASRQMRIVRLMYGAGAQQRLAEQGDKV